MKSILYALLLIVIIGVSASCEDRNFLDETVTTNLNIDVVFSDSTYTVGFLSEIYRDIGFDTDPGRFSTLFGSFGGLQGACDEVEYKASSTITTDVLFARGTVNPVIIADDAWAKPYQNIRRVNIFLKNVDRSPLSDGIRKTYKAEARFLRAWYYFIMLKHYGGIPLIGDRVFESVDKIEAIRNTFEECVDYIVQECDQAARDLVFRPTGRNYGRAGAGACKALKAKVRLFAASKLYNGSDYAPEGFPKDLLGYPTADHERWKLAIDAAEEVIRMDVYSLYVDNSEERGRAYYRIFVAADWAGEGSTNGTIFEHQEAKSLRKQQLFNPPSRNGNGAGGYPYQQLVDAYPMLDGSAFDRNNPEHVRNPYANRDPRLNNTILHDESRMQDGGTENAPVYTYLNEDGSPFNQDAVHAGTPTGYYICKMLHRQTAANNFAQPTQARPLMRYADLLLGWAEAVNEYSGPSPAVYDVLTSIRERAGILPGDNNLYGLKADMDQAAMRQAIRNERRIELAFEGSRFWDVRRWMIVEETETQMMTGMEVRKVGNEKTYTWFDIRPHVFRKAMYFWPIPYKETAKSPELIQNPYY
jgi:hypothetical protein